MSDDVAVVVMAKAPVPGTVKTRLVPALGVRGAAMLHAELAHRTLVTACEAALPIVLACAPDARHPFFVACAAQHDLSLHKQHGSDLGERMVDALRYTLADYQAAILIGCDCPALAASDLRAAADALRNGVDAVLLPVEDGGYALIGMRRPDPAVFEGIAWGTAQVADATRDRLRALHWRWTELRTLWDLDRPADLLRYEGMREEKRTSGQHEEEGGSPEGPQERRPVFAAAQRRQRLRYE